MVLAQKALVYANIASMIAPRKTLAMANLYMYFTQSILLCRLLIVRMYRRGR